ncbi:MAG: glycosyltransferase family 4 protein [Woeseiaceae bacterium]
MRLAYVDPQSYHGLAKYDAGFLRGLSDSGFEGDISFYCSVLLDQPIPDTIEVVPLFSYNKKRNRVTKSLSYVVSMLRILTAAISSPPDVYHFQWFKFTPVDLLCIMILKKMSGARVVFTAHNVVPHGAEKKRHRLLGKIYETVDHVIVHNASTAEEISRRFSINPERFSVLRHGLIDMEAQGTPLYREQLREFVADREACFLFLGRGSRYKGLDILLQAWPEVSATSTRNVGLIVMGAVDDDIKPVAARAVDTSANTLLLVDEHVPEADLYHALQMCDVVVLPHRVISQSGVLLSVIGLRVPMLVAALPGLLEPLGIAPVGWQFDGTKEGLVSQLKHLADNPEAVSEVRDNQEAWNSVRREYDWKTIARNGAAVYRDVVERS